MPIFEYLCKSCEQYYEFLQLEDTEIPMCPQCFSTDSEKQVSSCSFSLKGGGWFDDGYSNDNSPKPPSPPKSSAKSKLKKLLK